MQHSYHAGSAKNTLSILACSLFCVVLFWGRGVRERSSIWMHCMVILHFRNQWILLANTEATWSSRKADNVWKTLVIRSSQGLCFSIFTKTQLWMLPLYAISITESDGKAIWLKMLWSKMILLYTAYCTYKTTCILGNINMFLQSYLMEMSMLLPWTNGHIFHY